MPRSLLAALALVLALAPPPSAAARDGRPADRVLSNGRFVATFSQHSDKYLNVEWFVSLVDRATGRHLLRDVSTTGGSQVTSPFTVEEPVLGDDGRLAWLHAAGESAGWLLTVSDGQVTNVALDQRGGPPLSAPALDGDVLRWRSGDEPREHRLRPLEGGPVTVRVPAARGPVTARLRGSRARPLVVVRSAYGRWAYVRHVVAGRLVAVVEGRFDRNGAAGAQRVSVFDLRRRRRIARPVVLGTGASVYDAALARDGRVAVSYGTFRRTRLVMVEGGRATVVADEEGGSGPFSALRLDGAAIGWVRGGVPGTTPLR